MSLRTWKQEIAWTRPLKRMTWVEALEHSIRKWKGLRPDALERHGLRQNYTHLCDRTDNEFWIDSSTCACCVKAGQALGGFTCCFKCPVYAAGKKVPCDDHIDWRETPPYQKFAYDGDPEPMIRLLEKALRLVKRNPKNWE